MTARAYLDHNATSPLRPEALEAMTAALRLPGNASSVHAEGRQARAAIETAREQVAALVGAVPRQVVFTSGGTEANVMALSPAWFGDKRRVRLFVSGMEHASVLRGGQFGAGDVERLPVDAHGVVDMEAARARLAAWREVSEGAPFMASVMLANNETGAVQPVAATAALVYEAGGLMHTDAVQAAGKIAVEAGARGADLLTLSAHKCGGPKGAGALVICRDGLPVAPLLKGGGQERGYRAGTENVAAIAGFGAAAQAAMRDLASFARLAAMRDEMEAEIARISGGAVFFARGKERLPNTSCFAVPGMQAETLVIAMDLAGVAVSAGSACSSGKVERSHVLDAMDVPPELGAAAIRVSLGWNTEVADIERFLAAWKAIVLKRRSGDSIRLTKSLPGAAARPDGEVEE